MKTELTLAQETGPDVTLKSDPQMKAAIPGKTPSGHLDIDIKRDGVVRPAQEETVESVCRKLWSRP